MELKSIMSGIEEEVIKIRRQIHRNPELGFEEKETAALISEKLKELDIEVQTGIAGTGVTGLIKGKKEGPVIALRADMDALPIQEKNQLPYASVNQGIMHACGHDAHVAILLGAAGVLSRMRESLPGQVKLIFQPAEEGPGGAEPMIAEGVLKEPDVDAILGLHVWQDIPAGTLALKDGCFFASVDQIDLLVKGESSHGASPHQGKDAIVAAAQLIGNLQTIVSRNLDPVNPGVLTFGRIEGGYRRNVIADEVRLEGTVRSASPEDRDKIEARFKEITAGTCKALGIDYELDYHHFYPSLHNDPSVNALVKEAAAEVSGLRVVELNRPTMGGEDFAYFLKQVPGCFFLLGSRNEEKKLTAPHHNPYFNIDESILITGVELLVRGVLRLMTGPVT